MYNPQRAFLSEITAYKWAKKYDKGIVFPFDVPDSWEEKIFSENKVPAIYFALWSPTSGGMTFFPDSIAYTREEVMKYISLLPQAIRNRSASFGLVVDKQ